MTIAEFKIKTIDGLNAYGETSFTTHEAYKRKLSFFEKLEKENKNYTLEIVRTYENIWSKDQYKSANYDTYILRKNK